MSYQIFGNPTWIKCLECGRVSPHPEDVKQKYCANCAKFHEEEERLKWYTEEMKHLADYLQQQDPKGFEEMVKAVEEWGKSDTHEELEGVE